jgi:hypothetical protein
MSFTVVVKNINNHVKSCKYEQVVNFYHLCIYMHIILLDSHNDYITIINKMKIIYIHR